MIRRTKMDEFLEAENAVRLKDQILLSPITKYLLPTLVTAIILISSVYVTMLFVNSKDDSLIATCDIKSSNYVNCLPGKISTYETCTQIGCCWSDVLSICYHSIPSRHGYTRVSTEKVQAFQRRRKLSPLGSENREFIYLETDRITKNHLKFSLRTTSKDDEKNLIRILDEKSSESELESDPTSNISLIIKNPDFSITVVEKNGTMKIPLLTTSRGPLILTDNYWEWTVLMHDLITLYGLNKLELNGTVAWNYDCGDGSQTPAFVGVTSKGPGIGLIVEYHGPLETEVLDKTSLIILRGLSLPEVITVHVFTETTPLDVVNQINKVTKEINNALTNSIELPSTLGLHVCPENSSDIVNDIDSTISSMLYYNAPWDSHCIDGKFYQTLDEKLNNQDSEILENILDKLNKSDRYVIPHLTPMVSARGKLLQELSNFSLLLKDKNDLKQFYVGIFNGENFIYPNWLDNTTWLVYQNTLINYLKYFKQPKFIYLQNSWPIDETNYSYDFTKFDYVSKNLMKLMSNGTIPPGLSSSTSEYHYPQHNEYSKNFENFINQHTATMKLIKQSDISGWSGLRKILTAGIGSGLIGQLPSPMYICGIFESTAELCSRWYAAAVVFPHILAVPENLPGGSWLNKGTSKYASQLVQYRHSLLTYQRTTIWNYYSRGSPVLAPTFIHYPSEKFTSHVSNQFMWGESILVGLVTQSGVMQVAMKIPGNKTWRHLQDGIDVHPTNEKDKISIVSLEGEIISLVRPGHIVPIHEELSMTSSTKSPLMLKANVACDENHCIANGKIGYANDAFLYINFNENNLTLNNIVNAKSRGCSASFSVPTTIHTFNILGGNTYEVNIDICLLTDDTYSITLN